MAAQIGCRTFASRSAENIGIEPIVVAAALMTERAKHSLQVRERQWRSCLERLDGNIAADLTDVRKIQQLADEEALVMLQIRYDNLQEVVGLTRNEVTGDHLGHGNYSFLKFQGVLVGVAIDLHSEKNRNAEPDIFSSQSSPVALYVALTFKPLDAAKTRRRR